MGMAVTLVMLINLDPFVSYEIWLQSVQWLQVALQKLLKITEIWVTLD